MKKKLKNKELVISDSASFKEIVNGLIDSWSIKKPQELMLVNRMASTWIKMRRVEDLLTKYDLCFEKRNERGELIGMTMNQLAFYLKSLEADFRNYYKVLEAKLGNVDDKGVKDMFDFINTKK